MTLPKDRHSIDRYWIFLIIFALTIYLPIDSVFSLYNEGFSVLEETGPGSRGYSNLTLFIVGWVSFLVLLFLCGPPILKYSKRGFIFLSNERSISDGKTCISFDEIARFERIRSGAYRISSADGKQIEVHLGWNRYGQKLVERINSQIVY